eukprot:CAMPEP_0185467712 /NCGR_PEP_ID=MMETSP1365-20130426/97367_1 /TAXON_ID=38817 /ORGANISM="Gephyrocapsa oceanica, Strain RCC1303" /LENGTH=211 /DNA_ID=CAMNT_0028074449 /DNA_START=102 /DNA_END=734 /DNA_ORIENTATION=+
MSNPTSAPRKLTAFSKFVAPEPAPAPGTFANKFVNKQCVVGHWYSAAPDIFSDDVLTDREQMIDAVWMKGVCKALVAGATPPAPAQDFITALAPAARDTLDKFEGGEATPPAPAQDFITALAPAARDTLDKFEGGDKSAFAAFTTLYPTIASFPQLTPVALGTPLPAEVLAVVNTPEREDFEREEYELVDLSATNDAPATRWVISPGQSVY